MADYKKNETARLVGESCPIRTEEMKRQFTELYDAQGNILDFYILGQIHGQQAAADQAREAISEEEYRKLEALVDQAGNDPVMAIAVLAFCMGKGVSVPVSVHA